MRGVSIWFGAAVALLAGQHAVLAQSEPSGGDSAAEVSTLSADDSPSAGAGEAATAAELEQTAAEPVSAMGLMGQFFANPLNLILISAILFMFIVVRPQQQAAKQAQAALAALKKNDKVITASGIHGTVIQAAEGESTIVVRIDENTGTKITINRDAVAKVVTADVSKKSDTKKK
ncbi:MAG: hypothetical protein Aurels2KO_04140 [Aureliella sp.]